MLIHEHEITRDNGERHLIICFSVHQATIYSSEITLEHDRCAALRIAKDKERVISEFLQTFQGRDYTEKEVLKAYSKIDKYFKDVYKEKYPRGGYRGGGRPKGSRTERTERLNLAVTPDEKAAVIEFLDNYRKTGKLEDIKAELAPYLKQIDDAFGNEEAAREKWRQDMLRCNPALLKYMLEYYKIFGIEETIAAARKKYIKPTIEKPKKVKTGDSDKYINAVREIQAEQEKSRPKLRTLDEAYKEYQEKHKRG